MTQMTAVAKIADPIQPFDRRTSRSICDAVGERLQRSLQPNSLDPSPHLQQLLEKLRQQEEERGMARPLR
jgi:hypothetical protein